MKHLMFALVCLSFSSFAAAAKLVTPPEMAEICARIGAFVDPAVSNSVLAKCIASVGDKSYTQDELKVCYQKSSDACAELEANDNGEALFACFAESGSTAH